MPVKTPEFTDAVFFYVMLCVCKNQHRHEKSDFVSYYFYYTGIIGKLHEKFLNNLRIFCYQNGYERKIVAQHVCVVRRERQIL